MSDSSLGTGALVCIPTYNEKENIVGIVPAVFEVCPKASILVIDDNSPDGTGALANEIAAKDKRVSVLRRAQKEGLGKAYLAGFEWALSREFGKIVEFDADFSHDPKYLPEMLERLDRADVVVGSRRVKGGGTENWGIGRQMISFAGSLYARTVLAVGVRDLTGGFNGFTQKALRSLNLESIRTSGYGFQIEIKYRAVKSGLVVREMPIVFKDREKGKSKMSSKIFLEAMAQVIKLRFTS